MSEKRRKHRRVAAACPCPRRLSCSPLRGRRPGSDGAEPARALVTQNQGGEKVEICHKGKNTISISVNALPAHLRHGDTENECAAVAGATGAVKAKKVEKKQPNESAELPATETTKKKGKRARRASAAGRARQAREGQVQEGRSANVG